MFFDKTTHSTLYTIGNQETDTEVIALNGTSQAGVETTTPNECIGTKLWDRGAMVLDSLTGTTGAWITSVWGFVNGTTYPIAEYTWGAGWSEGQYVMDVTTKTPYFPQPTYVAFDEVVAGGLSANLFFVGKQYRGYYPGKATNSDKVIEGTILGSTVVPNTATFALSTNPTAAQGSGTGAKFSGLDKYFVWDAACFYANVTANAGTHRGYIIGEIAGQTVEIARTKLINGVSKYPFENNFYGTVARPTAVIIEEVTNGNVTLQVDFIAKGHRGQRSRR